MVPGLKDTGLGEPRQRTMNRRILIALILVATIASIFGATAPLLAGSFWFVLAPEWHESLAVPRQILFGSCVLFSLWLLFFKSPTDSRSGWRYVSGRMESGVVLVCFLGLFSWVFFTYSIPVVASVLTGSPQVFFVTVAAIEDPRKFQDGKCINEVRFLETATFFGMCRLPSDLAQDLEPGDTVRLSGRGTWMGIWVDEAMEVRPGS